jgi:endonuclease/exonuclease/phosphatase (EEP) superfamily protein YafD
MFPLGVWYEQEQSGPNGNKERAGLPLSMTIYSFFEYTLPWLSALAALAGILATTAGFLGRMNWFLDLFSHFRPQYFLLLLLTTLILVLFRNFPLAFVSGIFAVLNLILILPLYFRKSDDSRRLNTEEKEKDKPYRAVSINVLQDNQEYRRAASFIRDLKTDLLLLVEVNKRWLAELEPALESLPFSIQEPRDDNYGIALFSRFPILEARVVGLISPEMPSICALVALKGFKLTVLGTHPSPPKSYKQSKERNQQLNKLAVLAASISTPLLVMGDLNLTNWSPYYKSFIKQSGLRDSRQGFGIQATWPVNKPHLWIPIDHILHSPHLQVDRFQKGANISSDHFPVICDFSLIDINREK